MSSGLVNQGSGLLLVFYFEYFVQLGAELFLVVFVSSSRGFPTLTSLDFHRVVFQRCGKKIQD